MTEYDKQAQDFLTKYGIKLRITLSDSKPAPWDEKNEQRHHYRITLSKSTAKEVWANRAQVVYGPKRLTFDFWDSVANFEAGKSPTNYDILACISGDTYCPETFKDFCFEYGYDSDSIKALQAFRRSSSFANRLRNFFTQEEIEALAQIQ